MIETHRLRKSFGPKSVLNDVTLSVDAGNVLVLFGPNGAGKSTLLRILSTITRPDSGTARVNGFDIVKQSNQVRQSLGTVLAGERSIYWKLTARENLEYFAALFHIPPKIAKQRIDELLARMELSNRADDLVDRRDDDDWSSSTCRWADRRS